MSIVSGVVRGDPRAADPTGPVLPRIPAGKWIQTPQDGNGSTSILGTSNFNIEYAMCIVFPYPIRIDGWGFKGGSVGDGSAVMYTALRHLGADGRPGEIIYLDGPRSTVSGWSSVAFSFDIPDVALYGLWFSCLTRGGSTVGGTYAVGTTPSYPLNNLGSSVQNPGDDINWARGHGPHVATRTLGATEVPNSSSEGWAGHGINFFGWPVLFFRGAQL